MRRSTTRREWRGSADPVVAEATTRSESSVSLCLLDAGEDSRSITTASSMSGDSLTCRTYLKKVRFALLPADVALIGVS